jgi:hypothetical protein
MVVDSVSVSAPSSDSGSRSWRMANDSQEYSSPARRDSHRVVDRKQPYEALRASWDRDKKSISNRY